MTDIASCAFCSAPGQVFTVRHPKDGPAGYWPYANHTDDCPLRPAQFHKTKADAVTSWNDRAHFIRQSIERGE